jgi:flagellar biosynthetic protein FlhB
MAEQSGDKSHDATPYRRQQAREQGQVARSLDLASAAILVGALLVLLYFGPKVSDFLGELTRGQLAGEVWTDVDSHFVASYWNAIMLRMAAVLLPILGLLMLIAVAVNVGQTGFLLLPQKLAMDLSRIDPIKGAGRIFSWASVVRLVLGVGKVLAVVAVAAWSLWGERGKLLVLGEQGVTEIAAYLLSVALWTCLKIGVALLVLAILDYAYQRWRHESELRMTTQEVREEMKNLQGDPQILARRRAVQRQLVLNRLSSIVPRAEVVVTNPTHLAVALAYDPEKMAAPIVLCKGAGVIAERIRKLAMENDVPVLERKELAQALYKHVEINQPIPSEQYAAVAEVLRFVYELKGKTLPNLRSAA